MGKDPLDAQKGQGDGDQGDGQDKEERCQVEQIQFHAQVVEQAVFEPPHDREGDSQPNQVAKPGYGCRFQRQAADQLPFVAPQGVQQTELVQPSGYGDPVDDADDKGHGDGHHAVDDAENDVHCDVCHLEEPGKHGERLHLCVFGADRRLQKVVHGGFAPRFGDDEQAGWAGGIQLVAAQILGRDKAQAHTRPWIDLWIAFQDAYQHQGRGNELVVILVNRTPDLAAKLQVQRAGHFFREHDLVGARLEHAPFLEAHAAVLHQIPCVLRRDAQQALRICSKQAGQGDPQPVIWNSACYIRVGLDLRDHGRIERASSGNHPAELGQIADVGAQGNGIQHAHEDKQSYRGQANERDLQQRAPLVAQVVS